MIPSKSCRDATHIECTHIEYPLVCWLKRCASIVRAKAAEERTCNEESRRKIFNVHFCSIGVDTIFGVTFLFRCLYFWHDSISIEEKKLIKSGGREWTNWRTNQPTKTIEITYIHNMQRFCVPWKEEEKNFDDTIDENQHRFSMLWCSVFRTSIIGLNIQLV